MIDVDKWQEIFSSLRRHKLRTFLTALSVWWGIFMLVILLGAGKGLSNSAERDFKDDSIASLWIWSDQTSKPFKGLPAGRRVQFENEDRDIIDKQKGTRYTSGRYHLWGEFFITYKNKSLSFQVQAVYPEHQYIEKPRMIEGRWMNQKDQDEKRKVCVIGKHVQRDFFEKGESPIGERLNIKGVDLQIVGVFEDARDREMERIYTPVSTMQLVEGTDRLHTIVVEMGDASLEESKAIEDRVRLAMAEKHKFAPDDRQALGMHNGIESYNEFKLVMNFISIFIWFVGIGSIIAGVIGVSNIMLIIVKDRTREIGVRKALGATPGSIISMIVQEAVLLTSIAGYMGLASGIAIIFGIQKIMEANNVEAEFFHNPEVNLPTVIIAMLILIISGVVSGLIPAMQAVKIHPVVAMKS